MGLDNPDATVVDLNLDCLAKIAEVPPKIRVSLRVVRVRLPEKDRRGCREPHSAPAAQDGPDKLAEGAPGQATALDVIVPRIIAFMKHTEARFRAKAVNFMNSLLLEWPAAIEANLQPYLEALFSLGDDPGNEVRKGCYVGVVSLAEERLQVLAAHLKQVIAFMLKGSQDPDEEVAKEATEFWTVLADLAHSNPQDPTTYNTLSEFLPQVVPVLLKNMAYSENDDVDEGDDETVPDKPEDMRPRTYTSKGEGGGGEDSDEDSDDDDDDGNEDASVWNLRKCSAAGLDTISNIYGDNVLPVVLPIVKQMLVDDNWRYREAGILALGAISEGCRTGMQPYLSELFPFLFQKMKDQKPLVRSITCWTLGRYTNWVIGTLEEGQPASQYLEPLMTELLQRILDTNKKVQDAACSAFATLEEEAHEYLEPYLGPIVQNLMYAFGKYQARNLNILYDTIGTLADAVGQHLAKDEHIKMIMVPIMQKLATMDITDRSVYPVLECLASLTQAVGMGFAQFAGDVWNKCLQIITVALQKLHQHENVEQELIVCSLDLLSAITEALQGSAESLVAGSDLLRLLLVCMQTELQTDVRQSAFALVGDLSKHCIVHLAPLLSQYLPILVKNLTLGEHSTSRTRRQNPMISVCNNACWAVGELTTKIGADIAPFTVQILPALIHNLSNQTLNPSLLQNTAITLGRLALVCPNDVAPQLEVFAVQWCYRMARMRDDIEKDHACRGLCQLIRLNPQGILQAFVPFLIVVASWQNPPPDLKTMFQQILEAFTQNLGQPLSIYLSNPQVLAPLNGVEGVEQGIGWDPNWHKRKWDVNHLIGELQKGGYST